MKFSPQNVRIPSVSSANADMLAEKYSVEAFFFKHQTHLLKKVNDTHNTALINLAELFNIIPKVSEQQSTNRHNLQWHGV